MDRLKFDEKPGAVTVVLRGEHAFEITATEDCGMNSGRRRFRVECVTCCELLHEATTGPECRMDWHERGLHEAGGATERPYDR